MPVSSGQQAMGQQPVGPQAHAPPSADISNQLLSLLGPARQVRAHYAGAGVERECWAGCVVGHMHKGWSLMLTVVLLVRECGEMTLAQG